MAPTARPVSHLFVCDDLGKPMRPEVFPFSIPARGGRRCCCRRTIRRIGSIRKHPNTYSSVGPALSAPISTTKGVRMHRDRAISRIAPGSVHCWSRNEPDSCSTASRRRRVPRPLDFENTASLTTSGWFDHCTRTMYTRAPSNPTFPPPGSSIRNVESGEPVGRGASQ